MYVVRECIEDAARINAGSQPHSRIVQQAGGSFSGKILWLFAKNTEDDVTRMFRPLKDLLMRFQTRFARDERSRKAIMDSYAKAKECTFEPAALELSVASLSAYRERDLLGHEGVNRFRAGPLTGT